MSRRALAIVGLLAGGAALAWWRSAQGAPVLLYDLDQDASSRLDPFSPASLGGSLEGELMGRGLPYSDARGVAAGIWAESLGDPTAVNPTSGAFGIGQWLGPRKAALFARYGPNPSLAQQLDFLVWELRGGDHGGAAVLADDSAADTLDAYIRRFMRPAPGAQTSGDLARGMRYLG